MPGVVGMAVQDGERAVNLLEEYDARKFVDQRHFTQGDVGGGGFAGGVGKAVGRAHRKDEGLGVAVSVVFEEMGEFLGGELAAAGVQQNDGVGRTGGGFLAELEQSGFVGEREPLDVGVARDSFQLFRREGLDGGVFGFADPGNL